VLSDLWHILRRVSLAAFIMTHTIRLGTLIELDGCPATQGSYSRACGVDLELPGIPTGLQDPLEPPFKVSSVPRGEYVRRARDYHVDE